MNGSWESRLGDTVKVMLKGGQRWKTRGSDFVWSYLFHPWQADEKRSLGKSRDPTLEWAGVKDRMRLSVKLVFGLRRGQCGKITRIITGIIPYFVYSSVM